MLKESIVFQQDNAPIHKCQVVLKWLKNRNVNLMDWPSQSPDLNPIENVWSFIKMEIDKHQIISRHMLREKINEIWNLIPANYLAKLIQSMPRRVLAVLKNKGGHTKY